MEAQRLRVDKDSSNRQLENLIRESDNLKASKMAELQSVIATKNESMLELRENFSEIIVDKDDIITNLRAKIIELNHDCSDACNKLQEQVELGDSILTEKDEYITKLTGSLSSSKKSSDWLTTELSQVIKEKNTIGGSIQNQFENISKGLRSDIELFMEDKRNFESEFQIERLQLERTISEQQGRAGDVEKKLDARNTEINELNIVVEELKRRVEAAANILSKESYYRRLEDQLQESYDKSAELKTVIYSLESKQRELNAAVHDLELELKIENGAKEKMIIDHENQLKTAEEELSRVSQSIRDELEAIIEEERKKQEAAHSSLKEAKEKHKLSEARIVEELSTELKQLYGRNEVMETKIESLQKEKDALRDEIMSEALSNADEKMLKLKHDYEKIILEKDDLVMEVSSKVEGFEEKALSLSKSNVNLSKDLSSLEATNKKLEKTVSYLENSFDKLIKSHEDEVESILKSKGKHFRDLRAQFDEALSDKEQILESLRNRLNGLRNQVEAESQKSNTFSSEKEELIQDGIRKDLVNERFKISIDSLLNLVADIIPAGNDDHARTTSQEHRQSRDNSEMEPNNKQERQITDLEENINKAKKDLEMFMKQNDPGRKAALEHVGQVTESEERAAGLPEQMRLLEEENAHLRELMVILQEVSDNQGSEKPPTGSLDELAKTQLEMATKSVPVNSVVSEDVIQPV